MKNLLTLLFLFLFSTACASRREFSKQELLTDILVKTLSQSHFTGKKINNEFSEDVYSLYLKRLDVQKKFFYQSDIDELDKFKLIIDNELLDHDLEFYEKAQSILGIRIDDVQSNISDILTQPFDFTINESLNFDYDNMPYPKDAAEMHEKWRKILKYETLRRYIELSAEKDQSVYYPTLEKQAREKVAKQINRMLERMKTQDPTDSLELYFNAIANVFDPHTSYFAPKQDEDFTIGMTGKLEGIGALLNEDDGFIKVVRIIPGSASWRQKELEAEDIILKVGQGKEEPVDIVEMPLDEAVQLIRGPKGTQVRLTVKKTDGRIIVIPIIRDAVVIEETYAKSTVLENPQTGTRIGYIDLPVFYHDFKDEGSRSSSGDVLKEIRKLKAQNIQGMILDLRNNGGGALEDAIRMSGLFFKTGPVLQVKNQEGQIEVLNDDDPDISYEGPLIILVNKLSASASEIVSAALQDYKRAIIVGSDSTYGKGTVQSYVNIDRYIPPSHEDYKPLGAIKITLQKFYRVNGDTTQYKGVIPDIILPDLYQYMEIGEKNQDYSIGYDRIKKQNFQPWTASDYDLDELKRLSAARVISNQTLQLIDQNSRFMQEQQKIKTEPLLLSEMLQKEELLKKKNDEIQKNTQLNNKDITIETKGLEKLSKDQQDKLNEWYTKIKTDKYIQEACYIMDDILR